MPTEEVDKLIKTLQNSNLKERPRVRYEFFRDFFYVQLLSKETPPEKKAIFVKKWIEITGGNVKSVDLVNEEGEVVIQVPPLFDVSVNLGNVDGMDARYNYASMQDKNFDMGRKDKVLNEVQIIGNSEEYSNGWVKLIDFVESRLVKDTNVNSSNQDASDIGYDL